MSTSSGYIDSPKCLKKRCLLTYVWKCLEHIKTIKQHMGKSVGPLDPWLDLVWSVAPLIPSHHRLAMRECWVKLCAVLKGCPAGSQQLGELTSSQFHCLTYKVVPSSKLVRNPQKNSGYVFSTPRYWSYRSTWLSQVWGTILLMMDLKISKGLHVQSQQNTGMGSSMALINGWASVHELITKEKSGALCNKTPSSGSIRLILMGPSKHG